MKKRIILDAYNFLFDAHPYQGMDSQTLGSLRDGLVAQMEEYGKYKGIDIILVFDGHFMQPPRKSPKKSQAVEVLYSSKGLSADSIIERLSKDITEHDAVFVVSSDYSQQKVVFKDKVYRKSIREFKREIDSFRREVTEKIVRMNAQTRHRSPNILGKKIPKDIIERFGKTKKE